MSEKPQSHAQRVTNPVWLRKQLEQLVKECDSAIEQEQSFVELARTAEESAQFSARVSSHRHWKRQLERVLRGKTSAEDLTCDTVTCGRNYAEGARCALDKNHQGGCHQFQGSVSRIPL